MSAMTSAATATAGSSGAAARTAVPRTPARTAVPRTTPRTARPAGRTAVPRTTPRTARPAARPAVPATTPRTARPAARSTGGTPALRLVPQRRSSAARAPFVVTVVSLLVLGLLGLLLLNTLVNQQSFQLHDLAKQGRALEQHEQDLQAAVQAQSAPGVLAGRATQLGMVPGGPPAFLRLPDGMVLGATAPAAGAAPSRALAPKRTPAAGATRVATDRTAARAPTAPPATAPAAPATAPAAPATAPAATAPATAAARRPHAQTAPQQPAPRKAAGGTNRSSR